MLDQYYKVRSRAIRELIRQYKQNKSQRIFALILKRVDDLIFTVLFELVKVDTYLLHVELEDLYHTAIIGLHDGIMSFSEDVDYKYTIARIIAYIKCCIRREFKYLRKSTYHEVLSPSFVDNERVDNPNIEHTVDFMLTLEVWCKDLVDRKVFNNVDLCILRLRFIEGKTYVKIGKAIGCSTQNACVRTKRIMRELRRVKKYS